MKFELRTAGNFYDKYMADKLGILGFKFTVCKDGMPFAGKFYKTPARVILELYSLEDLARFIKEWGSVIVDDDSITIYDDYLE